MMSPSRGDGAPDGDGEASLREARAFLRGLLAGLHVLDALPERSRMLAVDAELPVHAVLATVLGEQHPRPHPSSQIFSGLPGSPAAGAPTGASGGPGGMVGQMRREGGAGASTTATAEEQPPPLACGVVSPSLPSNVLAEVCEFDPCGAANEAAKVKDSKEEEGADDKQSGVRRQWTSPDDGWGMHSSMTMQDLEKMPMGMPVTVGELADFLAHACVTAPGAEGGSTSVGSKRWADPVGGAAEKDGGKSAPAADMLDWSLTQWRAYRLKLRNAEDPKSPKASKAGKDGDDEESTARLFVEERPRGGGPVLVHRVPSAPPRPILCTDDPEASLLKAVELLLAYPELDALPIVNPLRCTVVAHLTLSYCLAYTLGRMRGSELAPVANLAIGHEAPGGVPAQRKFESSKGKGAADTWATRTTPEARPPPWVLSSTQPLRELLAFFASMPHSGVPIVEDGATGGVLGLLSRRDLLHFLDLSMQSARRPSEEEGERIDFDVAAPIEVMLEALKKFRGAGLEEEASNGGVGASLIFEKEITLKALALRVLLAENRKLLFVQEVDSKAPRLMRVLSVTDVWGLLIGSEQEREVARPEESNELLRAEI
mmetsp:Transcript_100848/g.217733  ORF Transcript_100848/g.217733 Transcript_100848/m.217733 type:complete len:600 (+) Transcript_100848:66-1865(+)